VNARTFWLWAASSACAFQAVAFAGLRATEGEALFNGRDLQGWSGAPQCWAVVDGAIRGQTDFSLGNTFLIWKGGTVRDFELRARIRLHNGNSGIQYRARDLGHWTVSGYQAEIANEPGNAGFLYEEKGRKFLAFVGESVRIDPGGGKRLLGSLGTKNEFVTWNYYRPREWNEYLIVARGTYLAHYVNGFKTIELLDEDKTHRASEGVLALQLHAGPPMTVEFRDIVLKRL
jgi:hypothetical protein